MTLTSPPLLQLRAVTKSFGAVRALRGVSFELHTGEVHALLGENGAGKSTLIRLITGAHQADSGELFIDGQRIETLTPAAARALGIACIYQQPALCPDLTVAENIYLRLEPASAWRRVRRTQQAIRARELLQRVGAELDVECLVGDLSMPEQQLVEIACAVGAQARIVIMDEPTSSLTRREQELLYGVVKALRRSGVGVIYISHRLEEIFALADRVTVLRDGATVGTAATSEITEAQLIHMTVGRNIDAAQNGGRSTTRGGTILEVAQLTCRVGGVRAVSFDLRGGEILGLAGLVGAGRTELARVLFGLTPADGGTLRLRGEVVCVRSPVEAMARGIAYLPEDRRRHGVIPAMSVSQNIALSSHRGLFPCGWLRRRREEDLARRYIDAFEIKTENGATPVAALSGGNQQKVALARWLARSPAVLILDEPTQGVDVAAKAEIHRLIHQLAADGVAVLLISSDLPEVIAMSHRIGVMREGALVAMLPADSAPADVMAAAMGQGAARSSAS